MDSMRHLSTSLPQASRQRNEQPSDLMSEFRQAAYSVSNLYKAAYTAEKRARSAGYHDALEDLLAFLDRENLGLMDGEGWRVRQWATQNLDSNAGLPSQSVAARSAASDDEREDRRSPAKEEEKDEEISSSVETPRKRENTDAQAEQHHPLEDDEPARERIASEQPQPQTQTQAASIPPQSNFTFQSQHSYPSNHEREAVSGMEIDATASPTSNLVPSTPSSESFRLLPRSSRGSRHNNHNRRAESRLPTFNLNLGSGGGNKRKWPYSDLFDISGFNEGADRKDGGNGSARGGKRGRQV